MTYGRSSSMSVVRPKYRGPRLSDSSRYVKIESVPIIDVLERSYFKRDDNGEPVKVTEVVDEDQIRTLVENSQKRAEKGEYGLVLIGHTDDNGKEIDQPPSCGYLDNYHLGEHNGNLTALADIYIDTKECDPSRTLRQFPRRSAEVIALDKPHGYIDSVALMKRTPERDLGLLTSHYKKKDQIYRFSCPDCSCKTESKSYEKKSFLESRGKSMARKHDPSDEHEDPSEPSGESDRPYESSGKADPSVDRYAKNEVDQEEDISSLPDPSRLDPSRVKKPVKDPKKVNKNFAEDDMAKMAKKYNERPDEHGDEEGDDEGFDEEVEDHEPSDSSEDEPSRMASKKKPSKMAAGGMTPGIGGATSSYVPKMPKMPKAEARAVYNGKASPINSGPKSKMSRQNREEERMAEESARIKVSRFQRELDRQTKENEALRVRLEKIEADKRQKEIEHKVAQLEYEGYELDRADEVARFTKMDDSQIEFEIARIRKYHKPSPVGQPAIPSLSGDYGGNSLPRPIRFEKLLDPLPEEEQQKGMYIIGSHIARFAADNEDSLPRPQPKNPMQARARGVDMKYAASVVSRYQSEKEKSRF